MAPEFRFPEAREDIDTAIKWVKANATTYKVDPNKIVLAGESAGGFLVNYAGTHDTPETRVAAVVDIYGPVDYEKIARQRQAYPNRFNMATRADVRRIALALPATEEARDRFAFSVRRKGKLKGFAWVWMKRIDPKKPRVPEPSVIALRVPSVAERDRMT